MGLMGTIVYAAPPPPTEATPGPQSTATALASEHIATALAWRI